jgi:chemotaxis protein CheY-P-specific phosphatase CheC
LTEPEQTPYIARKPLYIGSIGGFRMEHDKFAKPANYEKSKTQEAKNQLLSKALDSLAEILGIEFGSLTIHFHKGKWSPRIEIQKNVVRELER